MALEPKAPLAPWVPAAPWPRAPLVPRGQNVPALQEPTAQMGSTVPAPKGLMAQRGLLAPAEPMGPAGPMGPMAQRAAPPATALVPRRTRRLVLVGPPAQQAPEARVHGEVPWAVPVPRRQPRPTQYLIQRRPLEVLAVPGVAPALVPGTTCQPVQTEPEVQMAPAVQLARPDLVAGPPRPRPVRLVLPEVQAARWPLAAMQQAQGLAQVR